MGDRFVKLVLIFLSLPLSWTLAGENVLIVNDLAVVGGDTAWITVDMNNEDEVVSFQFDLSFPAGMSFADSTFLSSRAADHELYVQYNDPYLRVMAFNFTLDAFTGNSGTLVTIGFATSQEYGTFDLALLNPILGNYDSENILTGYENGEIFITSLEPVLTPFDLTIIPEDSSFVEILS